MLPNELSLDVTDAEPLTVIDDVTVPDGDDSIETLAELVTDSDVVSEVVPDDDPIVDCDTLADEVTETEADDVTV